MIGVGAAQVLLGHPPVAQSAGYTIVPEQAGLTGMALLFLGLRAFIGLHGADGVEAISNGVPMFRPPKARNAARTLLVMGPSPSSCSPGSRRCRWWPRSTWPRTRATSSGSPAAARPRHS